LNGYDRLRYTLTQNMRSNVAYIIRTYDAPHYWGLPEYNVFGTEHAACPDAVSSHFSRSYFAADFSWRVDGGLPPSTTATSNLPHFGAIYQLGISKSISLSLFLGEVNEREDGNANFIRRAVDVTQSVTAALHRVGHQE
jgi:hypothetical protein